MRHVSTTVAAVRDAIRRHPWWTDSLLALALTVIAVGSVVGSRTRYGYPFPVLAAIAALFTTLPIALRRYRPLAVLAVTVIAETLLLVFSNDSPVPVGVIVALYTVAAYCERRVSIRAAAWVALPITVGEIVNNGPHAGRVIPELAVIAIAWVIGDNLRTRRAYLSELKERAARLEREREEKADRAVIEERARIARELHDVIAHNVSVMVVQAAAGEEVFDEDPERARESLSAVASTGRAALTELRRLLGVIRAEDDPGQEPAFTPQPGIEYVDDLVRQVNEAGLPVELSVIGEPRTLPEGVGLCAYRIVQEALTNTLKHADATGARVNVRYAADALELQVVDDGRATSVANGEAGGHGLIGMRERVALFGGELTASPRPGQGYEVRARLPVEGMS